MLDKNQADTANSQATKEMGILLRIAVLAGLTF